MNNQNKIPSNENWNYPTKILFGPGRICELANSCKDLNIRHPLLVTDPGLATLPMVKSVLEKNEKAGLSTGLFSNVSPNPVERNVLEGVKVFKDNRHDGVIAFGGGSSLDVGKTIALMVGQNQSMWEFEDIGDNWKKVNPKGIAPIIGVPTNAGTGSEVGRASVILNKKTQTKKIIFHPKMLPEIVILDPELTLGVPSNITAATGMDALIHCLEAFCSPGFHPMADGIAVEGIRLIKKWLPVAYHEGTNLTARSHMLVAASMGATAFQKGLGGVHALSHPIGALYDTHHGLTNAVVLPYVFMFNQQALKEKFSTLASYLQLKEHSFKGVMDWLLALREELGIPHSLKRIGVDGLKVGKISKMAVKDPSAGGNPIPLSEEDFKTIFEAALSGRLDVLQG